MVKNGNECCRFEGKFGGVDATLRQTFLTAIFYAQTIEKFVVAIPDMIESHRSTKKVSGNQKS